MTRLRQRMIRDMQLRRFAEGTQKAYLYAVARLARYYKQSPDQIDEDRVLEYLLHMTQVQKLAWSTCDQHAGRRELGPENPVREMFPKKKRPGNRLAVVTSFPEGACRALGTASREWGITSRS